MYDQASFENARVPHLRWVAFVFALVMGLFLVASLLPLPKAIKSGIEFVLDGAVIAAHLAVFIILISETYFRVLTLKRGMRVQAMVVHRHCKTWGNGSGGQSWRLTLRYVVDGQTHDVARSVTQEEYSLGTLDSMVEIAVRSSAPRRWYMPPPPQTPRSMCGMQLPSVALNRAGCLAFAFIAACWVLLTLLMDLELPARNMMMVYGPGFAMISICVAIRWWQGEGRVAAPIMLAYSAAPTMLFDPFIGPPHVFKVIFIAVWIFALGVVLADTRYRWYPRRKKSNALNTA